MKSPILKPNGAHAESTKPATMQDLLDSAHEDWKFKRKDEAFAKVLNAISMVSIGTAQCMKAVEAATEANKAKPPE